MKTINSRSSFATPEMKPVFIVDNGKAKPLLTTHTQTYITVSQVCVASDSLDNLTPRITSVLISGSAERILSMIFDCTWRLSNYL